MSAILPKPRKKRQLSSNVLTTTQVALYMRVSIEDQAEQGTIEAQRDYLRRHAARYSLDVADEYADDGISGTLPLHARPEGRRLLQDAEAGRCAVVMVCRISRLSRNARVLLDAHDALAACGVAIQSVTEPFDTSTAFGQFMFQQMGSMAQLDRALILEEVVYTSSQGGRLCPTRSSQI